MTPEQEIVVLNAAIRSTNDQISMLTDRRRESEVRVARLRARQNPDEFTILAARHLTLGEGPVCPGYTMTDTDIAALRTVADFVARHRNCEGK